MVEVLIYLLLRPLNRRTFINRAASFVAVEQCSYEYPRIQLKYKYYWQ